MVVRDLNNIFLPESYSSQNYTSRQSGGRPSEIPIRNRYNHGRFLKSKFESVWRELSDPQRAAIAIRERNGSYIEFLSEPGFELVTKSMENIRNGIRLLNVRTEIMDSGDSLQKATVYVPKGKENYFIKKIDEYLERETPTNKPKNEKLVAAISDIKSAVLDSFWVGKLEWVPGDDKVWCEIWLYLTDNSETEFRETCSFLNIQVREETLKFPERLVLISEVTQNDLKAIIENCEYVAEIRRATETVGFFVDLENSEQTEWANDLCDRISHDNENGVHISILDTGVNNGHQLIGPLLNAEDCLSYVEDWGGHDHHHHGTAMAGVCAYGNLIDKLMSRETVEINHSLESYKILPPTGENEGHLYGSITANSISNLIINNPDRKRIICLAVTAPKYQTGDGSPSSWSAALDEITSGYIDQIKKLVIVSAGNIAEANMTNYPNCCIVNPVQNPGQSWNAITVGAYTNIDTLDPQKYGDAEALAKSGQISPYSSTSSLWDSKWPIKPEVVLEGGNVYKDVHGCFSCDDLGVLTTNYRPHEQQFRGFWATSAATAKASWMAAKIQSHYPEAWPETIRALLIHSAKWSDEMKLQFMNSENKSEYRKLLRACGYGAPDLEVAIKSAKNSVNLVIQSELQPFVKNGSSFKTKDMHVHELPWPKEVLENLFDTPVEMKITLSYFIEPGPGEVGWKDRYRYPSCALRFDVNGIDSKEVFLARINRAAEMEDSDAQRSGGGNIHWLLGPTNRNVGSIHSDYWKGTAAQLAMSNLIGIYPAVGWWRERHHLNKWDSKIRYSLIVSISTPAENVDLYTPISIAVANRIPIEIRR